MRGLYEAAIEDIGRKAYVDIELSASRLEAILNKLFGDCMCVVKGTTKQGNLFMTHKILLELHHENNTLKISKKDRKLRHMLCNVILGSESTRLQENISLETIQSGTVTSPSLVEKFLQCLAAGPGIQSWKSHAKKQHIHSIEDDLMFATSYGHKISNKHMKLGLPMKSLTESSQVIQILSHYGHCTNYHMVEELEAELNCNVIDER